MITSAPVPDARARNTRRMRVHSVLGPIVAVYCINCGRDGGFVTENVVEVIYLCQPCSEKYGRLPLPEIPDPRV